jgi:hypothetical protein
MIGWRERALVLVGVTLGSGCAGPSSRRFAVTVEESATLDCEGESFLAEVEPSTVEDLAKQQAKAWAKGAEANPPTPIGRLLYVNEVEERMSAWFAAVESTGAFGDGRYGNPDVVYRGEVHDRTIEGLFDDLVNTDAEDEKAGRQRCGNRLLARGALALTAVDAAQGRIRWTDQQWIATTETQCAAVIRCSRDLWIEGLEER